MHASAPRVFEMTKIGVQFEMIWTRILVRGRDGGMTLDPEIEHDFSMNSRGLAAQVVSFHFWCGQGQVSVRYALLTVFSTRKAHPSFWMGLNWNPWRVALISGGAYRLQRVLWERKEPASAREGSLPHDSEHWDGTGSYRSGGKLGEGIVFVSHNVSFFVFVSHCFCFGYFNRSKWTCESWGHLVLVS